MEKEDSQKGWCTDFKQQHPGPKKSNRPSVGFGKVRDSPVTQKLLVVGRPVQKLQKKTDFD